MSEKDTLKWLVSQEAGYYTAQCLDFDIAVQAVSVPKLRGAIKHALLSEVVVAREQGQEPFAGIKSAPSRYWKQFAKAEVLGEPFEIDWDIVDKRPAGKTGHHFAMLKAA